MKRRTFSTISLSLASALAFPVAAHDFKAGELRIDHPYAVPSRPGLATGDFYFLGIRKR